MTWPSMYDLNITVAHRGAPQKDVDVCAMELAAAHIAMTANPALTRKTARLKKVILYG